MGEPAAFARRTAVPTPANCAKFKVFCSSGIFYIKFTSIEFGPDRQIYCASAATFDARPRLVFYFLDTIDRRLLITTSPSAFDFMSRTTTLAQFLPEAPLTPPPGWVPDPQRYKFAIGVR
mmetsp:Transcript_9690/g.29445  ORF Transcript_9690/g.29445 Transcript_9690/m.29445 type:complete len:120 (-) Transcript_9690:2027-2386(-)